jgi:hypothetical protein
MRFTRKVVSELTLPADRPYVIIWDDALPGFGVRLNPSGKVWVVQYRAGGKSRRETLGRVDTIALEAARGAARTTLAKVQLGARTRTPNGIALKHAWPLRLGGSFPAISRAQGRV